jgi:hypothetical protein
MTYAAVAQPGNATALRAVFRKDFPVQKKFMSRNFMKVRAAAYFFNKKISMFLL